mgnify:FL=1|jgi:hypothetical protein
MGLIDKIRSSLPIPGRSFRHPEPAAQMLAFVLLERPITAAEIVALVASVPGATAVPMTGATPSGEATDPTETDGPVEVALDGTTGFVLSVSAPVPDGEAEANAANNPFWPDAAAAVARHRAHLIVSVSDRGAEDSETRAGTDPGERHTATYAAFARLVAALLGHEAAAGVYLGDQGVVYEPAFYADAVTGAGDGLPWEVAWFAWAAWESEGVSCGSTRGLRVFGHEELEVRGSTASPSVVMDLLANVASYIVESGAVLMPGETLGYTDDQKLTITAVEGSFVEGHALQIGLP